MESALAFEAGVLRNLDFKSVAIPLATSPYLAWYLQLWHKRIIANDPAVWIWWSLRSFVEHGAKLTAEDIEFLLTPGPERDTPIGHLTHYLSAEDARWLADVRARILELDSDAKRSVAIRIALHTIDYAVSFTPGATHLKRGLSEVFDEIRATVATSTPPAGHHVVTNLDPETFAGRARADLLYLRLPHPLGCTEWRTDRRGIYETWLRGSDELFDEMCAARQDRMGGEFANKIRYLDALDRLLSSSANMHRWAVVLDDDGWLSLADVSDVIERFRPVGAVYSRDFSDVVFGRRFHVLVTG